MAAYNNHPHVCRFLLERKAELNQMDRSIWLDGNHGLLPIMVAAHCGHMEVIKACFGDTIIDIGDRINVTGGEYKRQKGKVISRATMRHESVRFGDEVQILSGEFAGQSGPVLVDRNEDNLFKIQLKLVQMIKDEDLGKSMHQCQLKYDDPKWVDLLDLEKDPDFQREFHPDYEYANKFDGTSLLQASAAGHFDIVQYLFKEGADIHDMDMANCTALTRAAMGGHKDIVAFLCKHDAIVDWRSRAECTPLILASQAGHHEVVKVLLANGADIKAEDHWGDTALDFAEEEGHDEVIEMLKSKLPRRAGSDASYGIESEEEDD